MNSNEVLPATIRLYWQDDSCMEADAVIRAIRGNEIAFDRTCFYAGGGGQPPDEGWIRLPEGTTLEIASVHADPDGVIWHVCKIEPPVLVGATVRLIVNQARRRALARYHTVLHVLNTVVLRDYRGWITGAQIAVDYSRVDFNLEGFSQAMRSEIEEKVNRVIESNRELKSFYLTEEEFSQKPELLRTLEVKPPVYDGKVRVVEIVGFDAQACGGTHVHSTRDIGRLSIYKTENKGKINKRLYVRLEDSPPNQT